MLPPNFQRQIRNRTKAPRFIVFALSVFGVLAHVTAAPVAPEPEPASPREFYNDGAKKLKDGKLREAESAFQTAVASQDERIQPAALYNLGEVRYRQGVQELTNNPNGNPGAATSHAQQSGAGAISAADAALAGDDVQALVAAYQRGRGAQRELRAATKAVQSALEKYRGVLLKWERASGDFKSAVEMRPTDDDAQKNADIVDRNIARLVDLIQMMMQGQDAMGKQRSELREKMGQMKKRMPGDPGGEMKGGGDEDDDEDENGKPKGPEPGIKEGPSRNGNEQQLTMEEAERWLGMLKLDTDRKLYLGAGDKEAPKPNMHKGRDW